MGWWWLAATAAALLCLAPHRTDGYDNDHRCFKSEATCARKCSGYCESSKVVRARRCCVGYEYEDSCYKSMAACKDYCNALGSCSHDSSCKTESNWKIGGVRCNPCGPGCIALIVSASVLVLVATPCIVCYCCFFCPGCWWHNRRQQVGAHPPPVMPAHPMAYPYGHAYGPYGQPQPLAYHQQNPFADRDQRSDRSHRDHWDHGSPRGFRGGRGSPP